MSNKAGPAKYADIHWTDVLPITVTLISLPVILVWNLLTSPFTPHNRVKTWRRVLADSAARKLFCTLTVPQAQYVLGTSFNVYETWMKQNKLPIVVDELGDDARLLWIGSKRTDRMILYCHGGAFVLCPQECALSFWRYVQLELGKRDLDIGFAIMSYSLAPTASFPTPLRQAKLALDYLFSCGLDPQNLQLAGDAAGGNLVLQLLSHALHPLEGIPSLVLPHRIGGAFLASPWVSLVLTGDRPSHIENDKKDVCDSKTLTDWGHKILASVPKSQNAYIEVQNSPESWFNGIEKIVDRVLITAGGAECLRDDIVDFAENIRRHHSDAKLIVQKDGVHNDPFFDFFMFLREKKLGQVTPMIIEWFAAGFDTQLR